MCAGGSSLQVCELWIPWKTHWVQEGINITLVAYKATNQQLFSTNFFFKIFKILHWSLKK